jgi:hypothetical protein
VNDRHDSRVCLKLDETHKCPECGELNRQFVDSLREWLGFAPLYPQKERPRSTDARRFYQRYEDPAPHIF